MNSKRLTLTALLAASIAAMSPLSAFAAEEARELRLLQVAPFTGNLKSTGEFLNQAIAAYVKDVQESGEVPFRIVFEKEDDGYVAEKTVSIAQQKIKTFRPHAMVGVVGTSNTKLLIEKNILTDAGIPLIGVRTGAPLYSPNVIHLKASYANEVNKLLELSSVQGLDTVGVVYQGDEFGQDGLSAAQAFASKNPYIKIVAQSPYTRNTIEIGPAVATMLSAKPKSIVIIGNTNATAAFITELRKTNKTSKIFTISTADPKLIYDKAKEASIGVVFSQVVPDPYEPRFAVATDYRKFVEKNKLNDNSTTFEGYLIARITIDAAKRIKGPFTSQGMLSELRSKPVNLGGMRFNLTDPQRAISFVDTSIIGTNGQIFY